LSRRGLPPSRRRRGAAGVARNVWRARGLSLDRPTCTRATSSPLHASRRNTRSRGRVRLHDARFRRRPIRRPSSALRAGGDHCSAHRRPANVRTMSSAQGLHRQRRGPGSALSLVPSTARDTSRRESDPVTLRGCRPAVTRTGSSREVHCRFATTASGVAAREGRRAMNPKRSFAEHRAAKRRHESGTDSAMGPVSRAVARCRKLGGLRCPSPACVSQSRLR
jgi:hypothetical protein